MSKGFFFPIIIISFIPYIILGQSNSFYNSYYLFRDTTKGNLNLCIETTSFFKNNEYFDDIDGWTGIGAMLHPKLSYQPTETTLIEGGIFLQKYSGLEGFHKIDPTIRIRQKLGNTWEMVFGNIFGNLDHNLPEPMYRFDNFYKENIENGLQFLHKSKYFQNDLWINWEKFIFENDTFRERFVFGDVMNANIDLSDNFKIILPFVWTWTHAGGQIYEHVPDRKNIMSLYNAMTGLRLIYKNKNNRSSILKFNKLHINFEYYTYSAGANPPIGDVFHQYFNDGNAIYLTTELDMNQFNFKFGYWNSNKYINIKGENIFSSDPNRTFDDLQPHKEILTCKFAYVKNISEKVKFSINTDFYYNLENSNLYYSYALYFVYNDRFKLKRF